MSNKHLCFVVRAAVLTLCILAAVNAQTHQSSGTESDGGWVLAAYLGGASTAPSELTISQPTIDTHLTFHDVRFSSRSFRGPFYYGFRGGYFLKRLPLIGFEAEFIHLKVFSNPQQRVRVDGLHRNAPLDAELPLGDIVQQYSVSHGVNLLLLNVAARHRVKRGTNRRLALTARAGLGPTFPHTESRIDAEAQEQYEFGRLAWQASGGAELRLWRGMFLLGEYKFTRTRQRGKVPVGTAESVFRTHHGVFGVGYDF